MTKILFYLNISKKNQSLSEKWVIHAKFEALPCNSARRCLLITTIKINKIRVIQNVNIDQISLKRLKYK